MTFRRFVMQGLVNSLPSWTHAGIYNNYRQTYRKKLALHCPVQINSPSFYAETCRTPKPALHWDLKGSIIKLLPQCCYSDCVLCLTKTKVYKCCSRIHFCCPFLQILEFVIKLVNAKMYDTSIWWVFRSRLAFSQQNMYHWLKKVFRD